MKRIIRTLYNISTTSTTAANNEELDILKILGSRPSNCRSSIRKDNGVFVTVSAETRDNVTVLAINLNEARLNYSKCNRLGKSAIVVRICNCEGNRVITSFSRESLTKCNRLAILSHRGDNLTELRRAERKSRRVFVGIPRCLSNSGLSIPSVDSLSDRPIKCNRLGRIVTPSIAAL